MAKVIIDQTMSLDGFVAGPNDDAQHPLGTRGGEHLFDWYHGGEIMRGDKRFAPLGKSREIVKTMFDAYGAFVAGRRTYDFTNGWSGTHPLARHVIVLTHQPPSQVRQEQSTFTFTSDVRDAVERAKRAAGVRSVMLGTCSVARQALAAGLVDELLLHVAPLVLGGGRRLFDGLDTWPLRLQPAEVVVGPVATHMRYRVKRT